MLTSRLQKVKGKATVMTDAEQAHIRANEKLLLPASKETLACMLFSAFLRIDADREKMTALGARITTSEARTQYEYGSGRPR